uniref:protein SMG7-like n=1 Tax=Erigeron canadensis TaxID=72917 RepID=UPI001CB8934B|nr:protein SMG7-like [Erigeron canadensis]
MVVKMDRPLASSSFSSSSYDRARRLFEKNIELQNRRKKAIQARLPSDPNTWQQIRDNYEAIILEDNQFSEKHNVEFSLWDWHYKRIVEFRNHYNTLSASDSTTSQHRGGPARTDKAQKIRLQFKTFLSEATGFYHEFLLKIRAKYGLPMGQFYPDSENHNLNEKDEKKSAEFKMGLQSCHQCLIYLGDLARYKGLYGEGESKGRDYAAASSYYLQAASLWPSSGNSHHQLGVLANYSGDEFLGLYRYFRSLAVKYPSSTSKENLSLVFEKNRQSYTQLHIDPKASFVKETSIRTIGKGGGKAEPVVRSKEPITDVVKLRRMFKAFRVCFVRLNGILFTRTSSETFEEILSLVTNALQELLSSGPEEELNFGTDAVENGLFIVILVSILIFTVNNVKVGTEGQSYANIVQNTVLIKNALIAFFEIMGQLLKRCLQLSDPVSSFLLPGICVCVEWIACHPDIVIHNEIDEKRSKAQINFWSYYISLLNKLLSAGLVTCDDEDISCFTEMTTYDEGDNEYQPALWEDFELRGFLPLQPAQTFLDFSRKHSDSKKDKVARVKRILAAGKLIAEKITIDNKKVMFDSKMRKFVIGNETHKDTGSPNSNGGIKGQFSDTTSTIVVKQSKAELHAEVEDEDEVIVFRPSLTDNRSEVLVSKGRHQEGFEHVQNEEDSTYQFEAPVSVPHADIHQINAVYINSQSVLPANNYTQTIGKQASNESQSVGQQVNTNPQSIQQQVNNNFQSIGQPVNNYTQSIGQPVNNDTRGVGQQVNVNTSSIGQHFNDYTQIIGQPVNNYTQSFGQPYHIQSPMWSGNRQVAVSVADGLQGLNLLENGHLGQHGMHRDIQISNTTGIGESGMMYSGASQSKVGSSVVGREASTHINTIAPSGPDPYIVGRNTFSNLSNSSLKVSTNRPVRHMGPPPGFSSVRPKQINEHGSALGQNPLIDDYSWLDGYQLQSSMKGSLPTANLPSNLTSQYINDPVATASFPFPGKHASVVQFEGEKQKSMQRSDIQHESLQQQYISRADQQGHSLWKGNQFV